MSREKPASALVESGVGVTGAAMKPTAKPVAASTVAPRIIPTIRRVLSERLGDFSRSIDSSGAQCAGLRNRRRLPVLLNEVAEALVIDTVELHLCAPGGCDNRRWQ